MKQWVVRQRQRLWRGALDRYRLRPAFIIIGAQRAGTTSLYQYLVEHPRVLAARQKEVHFFDKNFGLGFEWYRRQFPPAWPGILAAKRRLITGEATPYYLMHPLAAGRVRQTLPNVRLIVLLRHPVDRAYSHYQLEVRLGRETLAFEDAIDREPERLRDEADRIRSMPDYTSENLQHYSYLTRGVYVDQLQPWMDFFPKEQLLILKSEDFYANPRATVHQVYEFLGLPRWDQDEYRPLNVASYRDMDPATRSRLLAYFEPHNQRLYRFMGVDWVWTEAERQAITP